MENNGKHFSHRHKLKPMNDKSVFKCNLCKEQLWGPRFSCEKCNHHLHKDCANAAPSLCHMFFPNRMFKLEQHGSPDACCIACRKALLGYVYKCDGNGFFLHPCCAYLPPRMQGEGHIQGKLLQLQLQLRERLSSKCRICHRKDDKWGYRAENKNLHIHVSCMQDTVLQAMNERMFTEASGDEFPVGQNLISVLELTVHNGESSSSEWKITKYMKKLLGKGKIWRYVKVVLKIFISAIFGDPVGTTLAVAPIAYDMMKK